MSSPLCHVLLTCDSESCSVMQRKSVCVRRHPTSFPNFENSQKIEKKSYNYNFFTNVSRNWGTLIKANKLYNAMIFYSHTL